MTKRCTMIEIQKERYEKALKSAKIAVTELCPHVDRKGKLSFYPVEYIQSDTDVVVHCCVMGELQILPNIPKGLILGKVIDLIDYFYTGKQFYAGVRF